MGSNVLNINFMRIIKIECCVIKVIWLFLRLVVLCSIYQMISLNTWRTINYCKLCNSWRVSKLNPQKHFQANLLKIFFLRISSYSCTVTARYKFELALNFSANIMMLLENRVDINYWKRRGNFARIIFSVWLNKR